MSNWIAAEMQALKDHFNASLTRLVTEHDAESSKLRADVALLTERVKALESTHNSAG